MPQLRLIRYFARINLNDRYNWSSHQFAYIYALSLHSPRPRAPLIDHKSLFIAVSFGLVEKLPLIDLNVHFLNVLLPPVSLI